MAKGNIRLYNTEAEYLLEKDGFELPNVSFVEDSKVVFYNPFIKNDYLKLKYNVTSTSEATPLISESKLANLTEIIIDGNSMSPVKEYTFASAGVHEVWLKFNQEATKQLYPAISGNMYIIEVVEIPTETESLISTFAGYKTLAKVNLYTPNGKLQIITNGAFSGCTNLEEIIFPNSLYIINNGSFSQCKALKEVIFPNSVNEIYAGTFTDSSNIERLVLPSSMTSIEPGNWNSNINLKEVIIPEGITTIKGASFSRCTGLTEIKLPSTVTEINNAFTDCTGLAEITSIATIAPTITKYSFSNVAPNGTLYVPYGCTEAYAQWMSTENGYLGAQGWTIQELPQE